MQVVLGLHVHEPLRVDAEEAAETQGDIGGYSLPAVADFVDAASGHMDRLSERVDGHTHRFDKLLAQHDRKPILVGEVGIRSAQGAAAEPWQSAEERVAPADPQLQADVLADWLSVLDRPSVHGVLVWRWFTDPAGGGPTDTDFTVQGKPAEAVLACAWTGRCAPD